MGCVISRASEGVDCNQGLQQNRMEANTYMVKILIIYHSVTGNVKMVGEEIAIGAREVEGTSVAIRSVDEVTDDELKEADGIAFGSPKYFGSFSPEINSIFARAFALREHFYYKVGAAFCGSPSQYGGQEHVIDDLIHGMLQTGKMIVVGDTLNKSGFIGGYTVGEPDALAKECARGLGKRLAIVAGKIKGNN